MSRGWKLRSSKKGNLNIIPLGGLSEIGLNCTAFEYKGSIIVVDMGLMFPNDNMLGVDYVIPDLDYLTKNGSRVKAIFITHGHEDHTGAIPYLLQKINVPVYGTCLTIGLINKKLQEFKDITAPKLIIVKPREKTKIDDFIVEPIRVTHSILDSVSYAIKTPAGTAIVTGDFKIDNSPIGQRMDLQRFSMYGDEGVDILLSDSTNAIHGGYTQSEKLVGVAFKDIFPKIKGRIIGSTFASNINRIQQFADAAVANGRKVCITGRSMVNNVEIASELKYINIPKANRIDVKYLDQAKDDSVAIVTTGSQGEPMSVLSRIAKDEHKTIKAKNGDAVIISSKAIPGNERSVASVVNMLYEKGVNVIYEANAFVHVSGHGSAEELKMMISLVCPRYLMPVHGERRMRARLAELGEEVGIAKENIIMADNGDIVTLKNDKNMSITGKVQTGREFISGKRLANIDINVIKQRNKLAQNGIIIVRITPTANLESVTAVSKAIGFISDNLFTDMKADIEKRSVSRYLKLFSERGVGNSISMRISKDIAKYIAKKSGVSPHVEILLPQIKN